MAALTTFTLLKTLTLAKLKKHFPVLPGWFSESALSAEGQLYQILDAAANENTTLQEAIVEARKGLFLETARGEYLAKWGSELAVPQFDAEPEEDWAARIQNEILRERVTYAGIVESIEEATGLSTTLLAPWTQQKRRSDRTPGLTTQKDHDYGRSTSRRRSSRYFKGGVIDIVTIGYSSLTAAAALASVGAGIDIWYTAKLYFPIETAPTLTHRMKTVLYQTLYVAAPETVQHLAQLLYASYGIGANYNYLVFSPYLIDSVLTVDDLSGYTWTEAIAGPIVEQPLVYTVVISDG